MPETTTTPDAFTADAWFWTSTVLTAGVTLAVLVWLSKV